MANNRLPGLRLIWADGAYSGQLIEWVKFACGCLLEIVRRSDNSKGFHVVPRRGVVEPTFGWLGRYRRLSKDSEYLTKTSEAMIVATMIYLMVRRLGRRTVH